MSFQFKFILLFMIIYYKKQNKKIFFLFLTDACSMFTKLALVTFVTAERFVNIFACDS